MKTYLKIADEIEAGIAKGMFREGEKLPPQRIFAYDYNVAPSTVTRAYGELGRRGLVKGEVGRGTFVSSSSPENEVLSLAEARQDLPVDLEVNFPILHQQEHLLKEGLQRLIGSENLGQAFRPISRFSRGKGAYDRIAADFMASGIWKPDISSIHFAGGGRQAIAASLSALVPIGGSLAVEALTYPLVKAVASRLGIRLVPIAMDCEGILPEALVKAHTQHAFGAVYFQSAIHNPTGSVMGPDRRIALADSIRQLGINGVEDSVYRFLLGKSFKPVTAYAPDNIILVDSFSKRLSPGLNLGVMSVPKRLSQGAEAALLQGGWSAGQFAIQMCMEWVKDGTVRKLELAKRADARARQRLVENIFRGCAIKRHVSAYHIWLELPAPWRSVLFVEHAAKLGLALAVGSAFAADSAYSPSAVRVALAAPSLGVLEASLRDLRALMETGPD